MHLTSSYKLYLDYFTTQTDSLGVPRTSLLSSCLYLTSNSDKQTSYHTFMAADGCSIMAAGRLVVILFLLGLLNHLFFLYRTMRKDIIPWNIS